MFYQQVHFPNQITHPTHQAPASFNFFILKTLSLALQTSLTKYAENRNIQNAEKIQQEIPSTSSVMEKTQNQCPPSPIISESDNKKSINNCQTLSQKTITSTTIIPKPLIVKTEQIHQEQQLIEQAKLPIFGLSENQRQLKMKNLLERRVDSWKVERGRKKSSRVTYNWY